jgi:hypothetical protein
MGYRVNFDTSAAERRMWAKPVAIATALHQAITNEHCLPTSPQQRVTILQSLLYSVIRFTAHLAALPADIAANLDNLVFRCCWKAQSKSYKWTKQVLTLRRRRYLGFGLTAPSILVQSIHTALVAHALFSSSSQPATSRLLALDFARHHLPGDPTLIKPIAVKRLLTTAPTWRLAGLSTIQSLFCSELPRTYSYNDVQQIPLHNNALFSVHSQTPLELQRVADVINGAGRIRPLAELPPSVTRPIRQVLLSYWPPVFRDFIANYDVQDPMTHTVMFTTPTVLPQLRSAVVDCIHTTLRNLHDLVEDRLLISEGTPALVPVDCVAPTATWWEQCVRRKDSRLLHWQFKYTVGAFPYRPRLAHIHGRPNDPAARACRNCHSTDETHQHLFIDCDAAVRLRQQWAAQSLRNTTITTAQQLLLWQGVFNSTLLAHRHRTIFFQAALTAITHRQQLAQLPDVSIGPTPTSPPTTHRDADADVGSTPAPTAQTPDPQRT